MLCTGEKGESSNKVLLHYKMSIVHRIVPNGWIQGGGIVNCLWNFSAVRVNCLLLEDIKSKSGAGGESVFGETFEGQEKHWVYCWQMYMNRCDDLCGADENFSILHSRRGVLGMANKGRHTNGSQFYVTLKASHWMDRHYVTFG